MPVAHRARRWYSARLLVPVALGLQIALQLLLTNFLRIRRRSLCYGMGEYVEFEGEPR